MNKHYIFTLLFVALPHFCIAATDEEIIAARVARIKQQIETLTQNCADSDKEFCAKFKKKFLKGLAKSNPMIKAYLVLSPEHQKNIDAIEEHSIEMGFYLAKEMNELNKRMAQIQADEKKIILQFNEEGAKFVSQYKGSIDALQNELEKIQNKKMEQFEKEAQNTIKPMIGSKKFKPKK
ncbi:MAG: hypothetical protein WC707_06485 [Candidatus Babeliaceae bacterium]|jgi:hypothetical protein